MSALEVAGNTGIWRPLSNVMLAATVMKELKERSANLPGFGVIYGPSGFGKTMAAGYCANKFNGVYVECRSYFTSKTLVEEICKEMGLTPGRTMAASVDGVVAQLQRDKRPLIIDEVDHIAKNGKIEIIRDIHDAAACSILLIGEERLPDALRLHERIHNRVLRWQPAAPASELDAAELAKFYCPNVTIEKDLLTALAKASHFVVRRICTNVDMVRKVAVQEGKKTMSLKDWEGRAFYQGEAPKRGTRV